MEYVLGAIEYVIVAIGVLLIGPCVLAVVLGPLVQRRERPSARTVPGPGAGSAARP